MGKPIIGYSIQVALESRLFDKVVVSTDDLEIAEVAKSFGAEVPFMRSAINSNDFATTVDVLREVHNYYGSIYNEACCIYATAPFVTVKLLTEAMHKLDAGNWVSVFPILQFGYPIQRALKFSVNDELDMFYPSFKATRSQDLEAAFHDAGMFYCYRPDEMLSQGTMYASPSTGIVISEMNAHDIDNESDWALAEMKYKYTNNNIE